MKTATIEIKRGRTGLFRFNVIAKNKKIVATSEHYTTKAACLKGIQALHECFGTKPEYAGSPVIFDKTTRKR